MAQEIRTQPLSQPPGLLRLPPHLRRHIYLEVGVARRDRRPYTYYLDGNKEPRRSIASLFDPPPARNFAGLLLSCRALYAEGAALLYSANQFVIYSSQGSLGPLQALSPTTIASLTSLKIVLNESSCHQFTHSPSYPPTCCCDDLEDGPRPARGRDHCAEYHGGVHRRPLLDLALSSVDLDSAKLVAQALLAEWHAAAAYLSSYVAAGCLTLSLVCDIDDHHEYAQEAARLAVAPLALFPLLKDCHVRLSKQHSYPLQRLAEDAVLSQVRPETSQLFVAATTKVPSAPRLTDLPRELRLRILQYTDLITPWGEVFWSRQYCRYQIYYPPCFLYEGGCPPYIHHGCRLSQCSDDWYDQIPRPPGCFCRRRHAAFTYTCNCWAPPTSLFLVCRVLHRDAQFVFFSRNRFIVPGYQTASDLSSGLVEPWTVGITSIDEEYKRFAASHFLRNAIPTHCLADLRFLELIFPPYSLDEWPLDQHPAMMDWRATVFWIRSKANAPALTIRVVFPESLYGPSSARRELSQDQGVQIVEGYKRILHPLRSLAKHEDLGAFYVQAAYPWAFTKATIRRTQNDGAWVLNKELELKKFCEDLGRDTRLNKPEPRKSVWQRWYDKGPP